MQSNWQLNKQGSCVRATATMVITCYIMQCYTICQQLQLLINYYYIIQRYSLTSGKYICKQHVSYSNGAKVINKCWWETVQYGNKLNGLLRDAVMSKWYSRRLQNWRHPLKDTRLNAAESAYPHASTQATPLTITTANVDRVLIICIHITSKLSLFDHVHFQSMKYWYVQIFPYLFSLQNLPEYYSTFYTVHSWHTTRYDTRCYFNMHSKADISQLNLPHRTKNWKVERRKTKK